MKTLLINPRTPPTFWSFEGALKFIGKKSSEPPLGLLTVAALLPPQWEVRLIDLNVRPLEDRDIEWADLVFLSGMSVQRSSFTEAARRCRELNKRVVAGGPLITMEPESRELVDHYVLGEAESILPELIRDAEAGELKRSYAADGYPDLTDSPIPRWELLDLSAYANLSLQYSRGCPFDCDFCNIAVLNGRGVRTKSKEQFIAEVDSVYRLGWRGALFIVDDNFIGNKTKLKREILPALAAWQEERGYPFTLTTESSINLADDDELLGLVRAAGFDHVFIGIETVNDDGLAECGKSQNRRRSMLDSVRKLQHSGLVVSAGFIIGFDSDPENIFELQSAFIQESGIPMAMVGLLSAPTGTKLYKRLDAEHRLRSHMSGNNMDGTLNFEPRLDETFLREGYRRLVRSLYAPRAYFARLRTFLDGYGGPAARPISITPTQVAALFRAFWKLGVRDESRGYFWGLLFSSLLRRPRKLVTAITMAIYGYHFRGIAEALG